MIINIVKDGQKVLKLENGKWKHYVTIKADDLVLEVEIKELVKINKVIDNLKKNKRAYMVAIVFLAMFFDGGTSFAATNIAGGVNLIKLMQQAAFWVGMAITIWGIVEAQLDLPGWKGRIFKGILGYIGVLLVPLIFMELDNNLRVDVWNQIGDVMSK